MIRSLSKKLKCILVKSTLLTTMHYVTQIFYRGSDDPIHDIWIDICVDKVPKCDVIHHVLPVFKRLGVQQPGYILCFPNEYASKDQLTDEDLKDIRQFNPTAYSGYMPPPNEPCVIVERYSMTIV